MNSADPDQMPQNVASDQGLHFFQHSGNAIVWVRAAYRFAGWVLFPDFVFKINFFQNNVSGIPSARVSNSMDPDQAPHFGGPDPSPNCLHRLSAHGKSCH